MLFNFSNITGQTKVLEERKELLFVWRNFLTYGHTLTVAEVAFATENYQVQYGVKPQSVYCKGVKVKVQSYEVLR